MDEVTGKSDGGKCIQRLRQELAKEKLLIGLQIIILTLDGVDDGPQTTDHSQKAGYLLGLIRGLSSVVCRQIRQIFRNMT